MTSTATPTDVSADRSAASRPWGRVICAAAAVGAFPVFAMSELTGDSGAEITAGLIDDATMLMSAAILAVLVSAGLFLAAVRLGRAVPGEAGSVVVLAGGAVALMYATFYAVFGAGGVVATQMLAEPGPGLGEAASLLLNITEIARFAPGLALVAAVAAAGRSLPRAVRVTAWTLVVLTLVPLTSWVAALLVPVWLGVSAAVVSPRR